MTQLARLQEWVPSGREAVLGPHMLALIDWVDSKFVELASKARAFVAKHFFGRTEIVNAEREVNDPLNSVLRTRLIPGERIFGRAFNFDQLDSKSPVFQYRDPELHFRQIQAFDRFESQGLGIPFHALLKV